MADTRERLRKAQDQLESLVEQVALLRSERESGGSSNNEDDENNNSSSSTDDGDGMSMFVKIAKRYEFPALTQAGDISCRKTLRGHFGKVYAMQWGKVRCVWLLVFGVGVFIAFLFLFLFICRCICLSLCLSLSLFLFVYMGVRE